MDASERMRRILAEFLLFAVCCGREVSRIERLVMPKAIWAGKVIAESDACAVVEGNQYFPAEAVKKEFLKPSNHTSVCPWKGTANYYHIEVNGLRNDNAAWYYAEPKPAAEEIRGKIAFWKGVRVDA
jgi:uncharacterized protein (DUF427 family)